MTSRRLWLDASVIRKPRLFEEMTEVAKKNEVQILVHAHVHLEICRTYRCKFGEGYSPSSVNSFLGQRGVHVVPMHLDRETAERWAERLALQFPGKNEWEAAKRATLKGELAKDFVHAPSKMPMTTDWWVALQVADTESDRIAVYDKGGEWDALRAKGRALEAPDALTWLASAER